MLKSEHWKVPRNSEQVVVFVNEFFPCSYKKVFYQDSKLPMKLFRVGTEQQKKNQKFSVPVERWDILPNFGTGREIKVPKNLPDEELIGVAINSVTIIG